MSKTTQKYLQRKHKAFAKRYELIRFMEGFWKSDEMQFVFRQNVHDTLSGGSLASTWHKGELNFVQEFKDGNDHELAVLVSELDDRIFILMPLEYLNDCGELTGMFSSDTAEELAEACAEHDCEPEDFKYIPEFQDFFKAKPEFSGDPSGEIVLVKMMAYDGDEDEDSRSLYVYHALSNDRLYFCQP